MDNLVLLGTTKELINNENYSYTYGLVLKPSSD